MTRGDKFATTMNRPGAKVAFPPGRRDPYPSTTLATPSTQGPRLLGIVAE
jgi:hypothetical protein